MLNVDSKCTETVRKYLILKKTMNKCLIDFAFAFQKVKLEHYFWDALNIHNNEYEQEAENNFSSEIVRHFRNHMEDRDNLIYYTGLSCHFDVRKSRVNIQPDIVIHERPNNQNRQEIFCEVKIRSNANLNGDLTKLTLAISDNLNFKFAVMIVANKQLQETKDEIRTFLKNNDVLNLKKMFLFHGIPNPENDGTILYTFECFNNLVDD